MISRDNAAGYHSSWTAGTVVRGNKNCRPPPRSTSRPFYHDAHLLQASVQDGIFAMCPQGLPRPSKFDRQSLLKEGAMPALAGST